MALRKRFNTNERTLAKLVMVLEQNLALNLQHAVDVEAKVTKQLDKVHSWFSKYVVIVMVQAKLTEVLVWHAEVKEILTAKLKNK
jgi:hypothetical protein